MTNKKKWTKVHFFVDRIQYFVKGKWVYFIRGKDKKWA